MNSMNMNRPFLSFRFLFYLLIATGCILKATAGEKAAPVEAGKNSTPQHQPTTISADSMEYDMAHAKAYFSGNVHIVDERMELRADHMVLFFDEANQLKRVEAEGRIAVQYNEYRAKGGRAVYNVITGTLEITENPILYQATNTIRNAEKVIYDRNAGSVKTSGGRPQIDFTLPDDRDKDFSLFRQRRTAKKGSGAK